MPTQAEKNQALAAARRAKAATGRAADQQSAVLGNAQAALNAADAVLAQKIADNAPEEEIKAATAAKLDAQADVNAASALLTAAQANYRRAVDDETAAEALVVTEEP